MSYTATAQPIDGTLRHQIDVNGRHAITTDEPTTLGGSDFSATLNPNYRWVKTSGIISPDKWGNLPGGEVFTAPGEVNGTYEIGRAHV